MRLIRFFRECWQGFDIRNFALSDSSYSVLPPLSDFASLAVSLDSEDDKVAFEAEVAEGLGCFLEFIEVGTRAILRLTVFISPAPSSVSRELQRTVALRARVRSSFSRFVRSSSDIAVSS